MNKAEQQAKKILWALYEAARLGEPMEIERTIIKNGLIEFAEDFAEKENAELLQKFTLWLDSKYNLEDTSENSSFNERDWGDDIKLFINQKFKDNEVL